MKYDSVSAPKHNRSWKRHTRATAYCLLIYCQKYTLSHCNGLLLAISERSLEKQFHKLKPFSKSLTRKSPQLIARLKMKFFATFNTSSEAHSKFKSVLNIFALLRASSVYVGKAWVFCGTYVNFVPIFQNKTLYVEWSKK